MAREDALAQAQGQQASNRQAALDAIAQGGRAGRRAFQQGQADLRRSQDTAMRQGASDAYGLFSAGTGVEDATRRITNGSYDAYARAMGQMQDAYGANASRMAGLNSNFFTQAAAAAPAYRALADEQVDEARRAWLAQKAAHDAASAGSGGDLAKWEIEAGATGLGEQMARESVQQGQEMKRSNRQSAAEHDALTAEVQTFQDHFGRPPTRAEYEEIRADVSERLYSDRGEAKRQRHAFDAGRQQVEGARATPEWAWQRAAADAMGVDPALAAGLFQPETPAEMIDQAQTQRQLDYLMGPGGGMFETPQAARDYQAAQYGLDTGGRSITDPVPAQTAAAQLGLSPEDATAIFTSSAFADAIDTMNQGIDRGLPIETINADLAQYLIDTYGHDFPQTRQLATMMFGHLAG